MNAIIFGILAALMIWFLFRTIRNRPHVFSAENMNKSFFTMGILALLLIGVIAAVVLLLRAG